MKGILLGTAVILAALAAVLILAPGAPAPGVPGATGPVAGGSPADPAAGVPLRAGAPDGPGAGSRAAVEDEPAAAVVVEATVRGRVVDSGGVPIPGAAVCVQFRAPREAQSAGNRRRQRTVQEHLVTGADGTFGFVGRMSGQQVVFNLQVTHQRHAPKLIEQRYQTTDGQVDFGDVVLTAGGAVIGRVTDLGGNAIPGARVVLDPDGRNPLDDAHDRDDHVSRADTDGNGFFRLELVMAGRYRAQVSARNWQEGRSNQFTLQEGQHHDLGDIRLGPGFEVTGVVYSGDRPVPDARVQLARAGGRNVFDVRTDEAGRFAIDHVPPRPIDVRVTAQGYLEFSLGDLDPTLGTPLTIQLDPALKILGAVIDAGTGAPVERYAIRARRTGSLPEVQVASARERAEQRMGSLFERMTRLSGAGVSADSAQAADLARERQALERRLATEFERMNIALDRVAAESGPAWPADAGRVQDHAGGRFELTDLQEGVYAVDVQAPDHQRFRSESVELRRSDPPPVLSIALPRGLSIAGRVVADEDGAGIERARVRLRVHTEDARGRARERRAMEARTDESGAFVFAQLPGGLEYSVEARGGERVTSESEPFLLRSDVRGLEVRLPRTAVIEGNVLGVAAEEARQLRVYAIDLEDRSTHGVRPRPDGSYEIDDLAPGTYAVQAYQGTVQARYLREAPLGRGLQLAAGERVRHDVSLAARPVGVVKGVVLDNARPAARYRVQVRQLDVERGRSSSDTTDEAGAFRIQNLIPGRYRVVVQSPSPRRTLLEQDVYVTIGNETEVPLYLSSGTLRGTVTAAEATDLGGRVLLLPGLPALPDDFAAWLEANRVVSARLRDGAFDFGRMLPGSFLLVVEIDGRERASQPVQVAAARDTVLQLTAGAVRDGN